MKAFVAGATGETGRRIVQQLIDRGIPVRALVRDLQASRSILPTGIELVTGDVLNPDSLRSAIGDSTIVFCATGARPSFDPRGPYKVDYEGTKNLVDVSKTKGIEHFVLMTSLCTSQFFHPLNLFWLILVWKKRAEDYLQASGLVYTIVRPGGLKNEDNADPLVLSSADTLFDGSIPRAKVAQVCVEAVFQANARNKVIEIIAKPDAPQKELRELFNAV